ncbi:MAG: HNH endonuclease [Sedimentisphaerales bacterium]|nr:HNH endonuclease [Sedimentisphaerales bacterium]
MEERKCLTCLHSEWAVAQPRQVLICKHKPDGGGIWHVRHPEEKCAAYTHDPERIRPFPDRTRPVRQIPLTRGYFAMVDAQDYPRLARHKWYVERRANRCYAGRRQKNRSVLMHREIMGLGPGQKDADGNVLVVDHMDRNGLNNTRANLRVCTHEQNLWNQKGRGGRSRYQGVSRDKRSKRWCACITHQHRQIHLGYFDTEEQAARAFDGKARELRGEFACLNFAEE